MQFEGTVEAWWLYARQQSAEVVSGAGCALPPALSLLPAQDDPAQRAATRRAYMAYNILLAVLRLNSKGVLCVVY